MLGLVQGCSVTTYEFRHPAAPRTDDEIMADMRACHATVTKGIDFSTWSHDEQDATSRAWSGCMRDNGYTVVAPPGSSGAIVVGSSTVSQFRHDMNECDFLSRPMPGTNEYSSRSEDAASWNCLASKGYLSVSEDVLLHPPPKSP